MVIKIEDITIIEKIFGSLTLKFIFIVYLINESNDIDELQSSLLIHEQKSNRQKMKEQALRVSFNNYFFLPYKEVVKEEEGEQVTIIIDSRIRNLQIISLPILK
jgi:hypothetical protein